MPIIECQVCHREFNNETGKCPRCNVKVGDPLPPAAPSAAAVARPDEIKSPSITIIKTDLGTGGKILGALFFIWGIIGLLAMLLNLTQPSSLGLIYGVLLWIGGMVLFGLGALMSRSVGVLTARQP